jgi:hypothetical protein
MMALSLGFGTACFASNSALEAVSKREKNNFLSLVTTLTKVKKAEVSWVINLIL